MHAAQIHARFQGVVCMFCGKPILLSASILMRVISTKTAETTLADLASKIFSARCRSCHVEGIYSLDQIAEFPEALRKAPAPPSERGKEGRAL